MLFPRQDHRVALLMLLFLVARACAEQAPPLEAPTFRFRGGEQVSIAIPGETGASLQQLVTSDGFVSVPGSGLVRIGGKTMEEAAAAIAEKQKSKTGIKDPQVSIAVLSVPSRRIYVLGEVLHPSPLDLPANYGLSLAAALSSAGGQTETADVSRIRLVHEEPAGRRTEVVDFSNFGKADGDLLGPALKEGDVVVVPRTETFLVSGEVNKPGLVSRATLGLRAGVAPRLSHILLAAGGPKPGADLKAVTVLRTAKDGSLQTLQFDQNPGGGKDGGKDTAQNPVLQDGDRVMVGLGDVILLAGRVRTPGLYPAPAGSLRISRLIIAAGGFDLHAKKTSVTVIRKGKPGEPVKVDVKAIIEEGQLDKELLIYPGDIVFVGESVF